MKKVLSLVLVVAMVISSMSFAFASTFEDVTDSVTLKAVDALTALGVVNGYEDGTFKPKNSITRAEMTKLLVEALGHGDLAAGSESSFKDSRGKWYDGYVAMASGLDIVNGYPDGTFKGDSTITYQEAVVMTLRALGYTNSSVNNGNSSYNEAKYKALAASLGLLKNITFKNGGANRGDVAVMLYNGLEVETVQINDKGLAEKIVAEKLSVPVPGSNPTTYKEVVVYEVLLDKLTDREDVNVTPNSVNPKHKDYLGDKVNLESYMYQTITAYLDDNGHVMFVKGNKSTTVTGTLSQLSASHKDYKDNTLWIEKENGSLTDVKFPTASPASIKVYLNGEEVLAQNLANVAALDGAEITVIVDKDNVATAAVAKFATKGIRASKPYINGSVALESILLPKDGTKVDLSKVTVTGAVDSIEDIEKNDVVVAFAASGNKGVPSKVELVVTRDTIEGVVTKTNSSKTVVTIDNQSYNTSAITGGIGTLTAGNEGVFYLDHNGDIFDFIGKSVNTVNYSLITGLKPGVVVSDIGGNKILTKNAYITLLDKDGKSATYNFNADAKVTIDGATTLAKTNIFTEKADHDFIAQVDSMVTNTASTTQADFGKYIVVGYELNSSNEIVSLRVRELAKTNNNVDPTDKRFLTADNVVVFERSYSSTFTNKVVGTNDLIKSARSYYVDYNAAGDLSLIIANERLVNTDTYAVITAIDDVYEGGSVLKQITAYVNGEKVTYLTSSSTVAGEITITAGSSGTGNAKLFALPLTNGKISSGIAAGDNLTAKYTATSTTTSSAIKVVNASRGIIEILTGDSAGRYVLSEDAAVYAYDRSVSSNNLVFSYVADINALEGLNLEIELFDADNDGEIETVLVKEIAR